MQKQGGLHEFMHWPGPILTDSGGFQVLSLSKVKAKEVGLNEEPELTLSQITEAGVKFRSHLDGRWHFLDAEKAIQIQMDLGADIIMAFDEADPSGTKAYALEAMKRTHRWLIRSKQEWLHLLEKQPNDSNHRTSAPVLFGIIQGGKYKDLRQESAKFVTEQNLLGIAVGGTSIGSSPEETAEVLSWVKEIVPQDKPLYAMGVGVKPSDVISTVQAGADMFDCVAPTRLARCGHLYHGELKVNPPRPKRPGLPSFLRMKLRTESPKLTTIHSHLKEGGLSGAGVSQGKNVGKVRFVSEFPHERLDIAKGIWRNDPQPIREGCDCYTCKSGFSRAYLHHLFKSRELLFYRLASIHNLRVMLRVCEQLRTAILRIH